MFRGESGSKREVSRMVWTYSLLLALAPPFTSLPSPTIALSTFFSLPIVPDPLAVLLNSQLPHLRNNNNRFPTLHAHTFKLSFASKPIYQLPAFPLIKQRLYFRLGAGHSWVFFFSSSGLGSVVWYDRSPRRAKEKEQSKWRLCKQQKDSFVGFSFIYLRFWQF